MKQTTGMTLIEVLIALVVVSIGLLAMASLQTFTLRSNQSATERSLAVALSYSILDAMRLNRQNAESGAYNFTASSTSCPSPSGNTRAENDIHDWLTSLQRAIGPGTCGDIQCQAQGGGVLCRVRVLLDQSRVNPTQPQEIITTEAFL